MPRGAGTSGDGAVGEGSVRSDMARARRVLEQADRIAILTGAGVSAESGVPTFRGPEGLWRDHRPEELATPRAFARDPRLVWEWYQWRRDLVGACRPNEAHGAIARLQRRRAEVTLVTQNVDGLHRLALQENAGGASAGDVERPGQRARHPGEVRSILELHGSLFGVRCTRCRWSEERREPVATESEASLPRCPDCGALVRPDVVWFGESLDPAVLGAAFEAARAADVCLVVGTSAVVQPAASIPLATLQAGGVVVEVNPEETPLSRAAHARLIGAAGALLPGLLEPLAQRGASEVS